MNTTTPVANAKLGELLQAMPKNKGGNPNLATSTEMEQVETPTLEEIGIDRKTASNAQLLQAMRRLLAALAELCDTLKADSQGVYTSTVYETPQSTGNSILLATRRAG